MAQITTTLYNTIAQSYAAIDVALSGISLNARAALDAIVNVDTLDYPNPSNASADAALEIELALLQVFNNAYIGSQNIERSNSSLLDAVTAVNDFVITNTAGTATATAKLLAWINGVGGDEGVSMQTEDWSASYCPDGWANISEDAGYTVTGWNTVLYPAGRP